MSKDHVRKSKALSVVLRHSPQSIGIALDDRGWADVSELLARLPRMGVRLSRKELETIVRESDKQRFAFSADGRFIRANQGHSVTVDLGLKPTTPPNVLYHGTAGKNLDSIMRSGLLKANRQHVHLHTDIKLAKSVGARHGKPVLLQVDTQAMSTEGFSFYVSENGVWLTEHVPARYIAVRW